jgi:hypothetical protein
MNTCPISTNFGLNSKIYEIPVFYPGQDRLQTGKKLLLLVKMFNEFFNNIGTVIYT